MGWLQILYSLLRHGRMQHDGQLLQPSLPPSTRGEDRESAADFQDVNDTRSRDVHR
jgi:hypothetical protein